MARTKGSKNKAKQLHEVGITQLSLQMIHQTNDLCTLKLQQKGFSDFLTSVISDINKMQGEVEKKILALNAKLHELEKLVVDLAGSKSEDAKEASKPDSNIN